jgi:ParB/RepB/Spo0J family partition protein
MVEIQEISPERINFQSPNIRSVIDETGSLAASMEAHGQLEPGTGWWEDNRFRIATGHRRAGACRHLGIPFLARIIEPMDDARLVEYQLVENVQAESLIPEDLERAVAVLAEAYPSHREAGERIGKSAGWVSTIIGALAARESLSAVPETGRVPDAAGRAEAGDSASPAKSLSTTAAAKFGRLKDEANRRAAFEDALRRNKGDRNLPRNLVDNVVEEYKEKEIRDPRSYIWKLHQEREKLVRKRADIEAEIDRIDAKIARLSEKL